ncbi:hypothetical protein L226DRAFT_614346 [Lentinus tigrinus ALCF2SS1-7]|uniref:Uncharacterized protein n=1 Tax=Lentinus tigrinus ALCF2SS1-6 TaxID=1328759 RepID=A0A5C2S7E5_9APHY|nr:hypothetical protein L227DRAFT_655662 [Lentinus tigrinus ALCF2SS1-6]RPD73089.1 hypothetical protein L226DRAFT_614346 [Lentinus tigrinus ALCF2SS1-7]
MPLVSIDFGALHSKALIGILLSSNDSRAKGIMEDLAEDLHAKEIINRVDNSPYGYKGRSRGGDPDEPCKSTTRPAPGRQQRHAHDSDQVIKRSAAHRDTLLPDDQFASRTVEDVEDKPEDVPESGYSDAVSSISSHLGPCRQWVPTLLLLTMFSLAARYSPSAADVSPPPSKDSTTWITGDEYMEDAKVILGDTLSPSASSAKDVEFCTNSRQLCVQVLE